MAALRRDNPALQVLLAGQWRYVFCRNVSRRDPVTTHDRAKALGADALGYFRRHFSGHAFRLDNN